MHKAAHASHQVVAVIAVGQVDNAVLDCAISADEVAGDGQGGLDIEGQAVTRVLEVDAQHVVAGTRQVRIAIFYRRGITPDCGVEILNTRTVEARRPRQAQAVER